MIDGASEIFLRSSRRSLVAWSAGTTMPTTPAVMLKGSAMLNLDLID